MELEAQITQLRRLVRSTDFCLTDGAFEETQRLFFLCRQDPKASEELRGRTPEYGRAEYFLNADGDGSVVASSQDAVSNYAETCRVDDSFAGWLQEVLGEPPRLGIARWLAHLVGFRHRSVQLFLDDPVLEEATYLQVRSFDKYDSPGCFDMPVAGHVQGATPLLQSLADELGEELGLDLERDVEGLRLLGGYDHLVTPRRPEYLDVEYATVYRGSLAADAFRRVRFPDGEVAAIALFRLSELRTLLRDCPGRVAPGLAGSFRLYR